MSKPFVVRRYGRASTERQVMSPQQQDDVTLEALSLYRKVRPDWKNAIDGGFFFDEATSRTSKITHREVGSLVLASTLPGDCIMAAKFDRMFANVIDVCEVIDLIEQKQFKVAILDMDIDISTAMGQAVFKIMSAIKELEVKEIRQRSRDSAAYRRKFGLPNNYKSPIGWRIADNEAGDGRIFVPDEGHRNLALKLVAIRSKPEHRFCSLDLFTTAVNRQGLRHPSGAPWTRPALTRWLDAARRGFPKCGHGSELPDESEDDLATASSSSRTCQ